MKIKTYPLQFVEDKLQAIKDIANERNQSIKEFIHDAIDKEVENAKEGD